MTFLLNHKPVDALALIVHAKAVEETGRYWVEKLCAYYTLPFPPVSVPTDPITATISMSTAISI